MSSRKKTKATLQGSVFLSNPGKDTLDSAQMDLLLAISECGSISAAAKKVGISYKTAWDRMDAMNNLSDQPLLVRSTGGARGGGTTLTAHAQRMLEGFRQLSEEHQAFLQRMGSRLQSFSDVAGFIKTTTIATSARNQYRCRIAKITKGSVNAEVALQLGDKLALTAQITSASLAQLGLKKGRDIIALVKASWIILSRDPAVLTSARNKLCGQISRVARGAVNSEVIIDLGAGKSICALVTNSSVREMKLKAGDSVCALFKASSVILVQS